MEQHAQKPQGGQGGENTRDEKKKILTQTYLEKTGLWFLLLEIKYSWE